MKNKNKIKDERQTDLGGLENLMTRRLGTASTTTCGEENMHGKSM
jgi:hypothetical protein